MGLLESAKKDVATFSSMIKPETIAELDLIKQDVSSIEKKIENLEALLQEQRALLYQKNDRLRILKREDDYVSLAERFSYCVEIFSDPFFQDERNIAMVKDNNPYKHGFDDWILKNRNLFWSNLQKKIDTYKFAADNLIESYEDPNFHYREFSRVIDEYCVAYSYIREGVV